MNGMKLALQQKNSIQMIQIYKEKVMEIIRLSSPGYKIYKDDIDKQMNIASKSAWEVSSGGKSFLGLLFSSKEEKKSLPSFDSALKKHNVTVGNIFILVVLPNGKTIAHRQELKMNAYEISQYSNYDKRTSGIYNYLTDNFPNFKQKIVNEYMQQGYRVPQNEITKYLLNNGRELVMTRGK